MTVTSLDPHPLPPWPGELTSLRVDEPSGTWSVIAVHSTRRGPAVGGTRAMTYPSLREAVADARRLADAMTAKVAVAGLPMGGGKSVLALPAPRHRLDDATWRRALEAHGRHIELLHGTYWTGPDIGTGSADMDELRQHTTYAFGRAETAGGSGSSAEATAVGVVAAVRAAVREAGRPGLAGLRILVQGLGAVGLRVAELVVAAGARLLVADVDPARVAAAAGLAGAVEVVAPEAVTRTPCDVLVPGAVGGLIDLGVARELPCRIVVGAANNVLADPAAADVLAARGVVVAPDFVANAGGAIHLVGREVLGWSAAQVLARAAAIEDTLAEVFADARARGIGSVRAALDRAERSLATEPAA
ncbi:Glu/Leu/Phe/Val dehydrogenase dimerization domain-containing protein [Pseudonocardia sp. NPDC049154]|uniref:Glu/Leu/Phe/Val dehydrogenase dimerization domain-containing protein n=1 Tax=Pseudonocardia sp. NPDC049154 TaxID=3155501 RepID=UPI003402D15F